MTIHRNISSGATSSRGAGYPPPIGHIVFSNIISFSLISPPGRFNSGKGSEIK